MIHKLRSLSMSVDDLSNKIALTPEQRQNVLHWFNTTFPHLARYTMTTPVSIESAQQLINDVVVALQNYGPQSPVELADYLSSQPASGPPLQPWQVLVTLAILQEDGQVQAIDQGGLWAMVGSLSTQAQVEAACRHRDIIRAQRRADTAVRLLLEDAPDVTNNEIYDDLRDDFTHNQIVCAMRKSGRDRALFPNNYRVVLTNGPLSVDDDGVEDDDHVCLVQDYQGDGMYTVRIMTDTGSWLTGDGVLADADETDMHPWIGTTFVGETFCDLVSMDDYHLEPL